MIWPKNQNYACNLFRILGFELARMHCSASAGLICLPFFWGCDWADSFTLPISCKEEEEVGQDKTLFRQEGEQSAYRKKQKTSFYVFLMRRDQNRNMWDENGANGANGADGAAVICSCSQVWTLNSPVRLPARTLAECKPWDAGKYGSIWQQLRTNNGIAWFMHDSFNDSWMFLLYMSNCGRIPSSSICGRL